MAAESRAYMGYAGRPAFAEPGDDMLGMLVREHGDDLTRDELIGIASLLLIAGHETTANMLALGTLALLRHPEQAAMVREDPDAVAPAVEELMRYLSIVHASVPRVAIADTEVAGQAIAAGDMVLVELAAADRDRALVEDPDQLDVGRAAAPHVAFGHGVHHCLGAPLARMEMAIAFPALLRRFPTLATTTDLVAGRLPRGHVHLRHAQPCPDLVSAYGTTVTGHFPALINRPARDPTKRCPAFIEAPTTTASARRSSAARTISM